MKRAAIQWVKPGIIGRVKRGGCLEFYQDFNSASFQVFNDHKLRMFEGALAAVLPVALVALLLSIGVS
ncbi:hypothetical protein A9K65_033000 (plasmid) [Mesorhizobium sp. WSM1497]|nr:hypothetical protein A9K65_033000 [Mesorhizobium sp. WSM1497]